MAKYALDNLVFSSSDCSDVLQMLD